MKSKTWVLRELQWYHANGMEMQVNNKMHRIYSITNDTHIHKTHTCIRVCIWRIQMHLYQFWIKDWKLCLNQVLKLFFYIGSMRKKQQCCLWSWKYYSVWLWVENHVEYGNTRGTHRKKNENRQQQQQHHTYVATEYVRQHFHSQRINKMLTCWNAFTKIAT